jgi:carboxypeptidase Taq
MGHRLSKMAGRIDVTAHPYMTHLGPHDVRLLVKLREDFLKTLGSAIHEVGHGLYQQGCRDYYSPMGRLTAIGLHESQSRLWECTIGKSQAFAQYLYGVLSEEFPEVAEQTSTETVWQAQNWVEPGLRRIGSDDFTYAQHIVIRTTLERELIEGTLDAHDLSSAWSNMYTDLLGVTPENDTSGVLQDDHWFEGYFGYFPTYTLGDMYAAQFWNALTDDVADVQDKVAHGSFGEILYWLRTNIHQHGRRYTANELLCMVTGAPFSADPYLEQMEKRATQIIDSARPENNS